MKRFIWLDCCFVVELGCSLRFIVQSAAAGGSSSSLAGCRAAVPPLTHPIQRLFACFASFSIRSGRPMLSPFIQLSISSPILKERRNGVEEMSWAAALKDWFHSQIQSKIQFFHFFLSFLNSINFYCTVIILFYFVNSIQSKDFMESTQ